MNLKCTKCGSMKFKKSIASQVMSYPPPDTKEYTCYECGQVVKTKTLIPEYQTVVLHPNEKVVE